jgi:hypothetical protein
MNQHLLKPLHNVNERNWPEIEAFDPEEVLPGLQSWKRDKHSMRGDILSCSVVPAMFDSELRMH